jgi:molybdopterin-guanine dinucleotide biosynthesis protein A
MSKHQRALTQQGTRSYPDVHAAVLAGGKSRRFGSDKCVATLPGDDRSFLARTVGACREVAARVVVVGADRPGFAVLADAWIPDLIAHEGPLVGLAAALLDCRAPYLLLAACDQPLLTGPILRRLADRRAEADIVFFAIREGMPSLFPSLHRRDVALSHVEERIQAGERSLRSIFSSNDLRVLAIEVSAADRAALQDIDTLADLENMSASLPLGSDPVQ